MVVYYVLLWQFHDQQKGRSTDGTNAQAEYAQSEGRSTGGAGTLEIVLHQVLDGVILFVLLAGNSALTPL